MAQANNTIEMLPKYLYPLVVLHRSIIVLRATIILFSLPSQILLTLGLAK